MQEQTLAILAATFASITLIAAYARLFPREGRVELLFWAMGWACYLLRVLAEPFFAIEGSPAWLPHLTEPLLVVGASFVLWGTLIWLGQASRGRGAFLGAATMAAVAAVATHPGGAAMPHVIADPTWIYAGAAFLLAGAIILRSGRIGGTLRNVAGAIFLAWAAFNFAGPLMQRSSLVGPKLSLPGAVLAVLTTAGLLLAFIDRQRAEAQEAQRRLSHAQARSRALFEGSADAVYLVDPRGLIRDINQAACRMLGYQREELLGRHIAGLSACGDRAGLDAFLASLMPGKGVLGQDMALRKDGSTLPVEVHVVLLADGDERLALAVARDVSARVRAEEENRQSRERLRAILDHHFQLTGLLDAQGRVVAANRAALQLIKSREEDVVGKHIAQTPWWQDFPRLEEAMSAHLPAALRGEFVRFEAELVSGGASRTMDMSYTPVLNDRGEVVFVVPEGRDITELRRVQQALMAAERERALLLDAMDALVVHCDPALRIVWTNRPAAAEAGVEPGDLHGRPAAGLWHHPQEIRPDHPLSVAAASGQPQEWQVRTPQGRTWQVHAHPLLDGAGRVSGLVEISRDVTQRRRLEEALRESEVKHRTYFQHAPSGIFVTDAQGRIIDVNPAACAMSGYAAGELLQRTLSDLAAPPGGAPESADAPETAVAPRAVFVRKDGQRRWWSVRSEALGDGRRIAFAIDQTQAVDAQRRLRLTQSMVDHAGDGVYWMNQDGRFIYVNASALATSGFTAEEFERMRAWELAEGVTRETWLSIWEQIRAAKTVKKETWAKSKQGRFYPVDVVATVMEFEGETFLCATVRDMSERVEAQRALQESQERYRLVAENIADVIWTLGPDLERMTYVSPSAVAVLGYTPEELMALAPENYLTGPSAQDARRRLGAIRDREAAGSPDDQIRRVELEWRRKDGSTAWMETTTRRLRDADGKLVGLVGVTRDIADRLRSERELRTSEARYRSLVENLPQRVFMKDRDSRYISANALYARDLGLTPEQVVGRVDHEFYPRDLAEKYCADDRRVMSTGLPMEFDEDYIEAGRKRIVRTIKVPVKDASGMIIGLLGVFTDITDRRATEEALRRSEERYRTLFESAIDGIALADAQTGVIIDCNQSLADMVGRTRQELIGAPQALLHPPEDRAPSGLSREFETHSRSRASVVIPTRVITRDGRLREVSIKAQSMTLEGRVASLGIFRDTSDAMRLEEELRHAQKMEVIGQLAGGIAHDFRNQITVVQGYGEMLEQEPGLSAQGREMIQEILKAVSRSAEMTSRLLALGRKQRLEPRVVDLVATLTDISRALPRLVGPTVRVRIAHRQSVCRVNLDPLQFQQAVVNMVINARHAMPSGGDLTIETYTTVLAPDVAARSPDLAPGDYAVVNISDTGQGIAPEVITRIFEPYFTTKDVGEGTGLGLAIVYGFVKQSGGSIEVRSVPGQGTVFRMLFPLVIAPPQEIPASGAPAHVRPAQPLSGRGKLLLVEDEPQVREVAARVLRGAGFDLVAATSGPNALEMAKAPGFAVDVLVTDVVMPGMSGAELAREMRKRFPAIRVVFMTGYAGRDTKSSDFSDIVPSELLGKPFASADLIDAVARAQATAWPAP